MQDVIDFFFNVITQFWVVVVQHWVLSAFVLISILNWVVTLINGSNQE